MYNENKILFWQKYFIVTNYSKIFVLVEDLELKKKYIFPKFYRFNLEKDDEKIVITPLDIQFWEKYYINNYSLFNIHYTIELVKLMNLPINEQNISKFL